MASGDYPQDYRDYPAAGYGPNGPIRQGVSTAAPGSIPPSFTPYRDGDMSRTRAFQAPENFRLQNPESLPEVRFSAPSVWEKQETPGNPAPVPPVTPGLPDRHDAYLKAQEILNARHYETQGERLDAELRLAEWLLA